jgi:hypothetical protein
MEEFEDEKGYYSRGIYAYGAFWPAQDGFL